MAAYRGRQGRRGRGGRYMPEPGGDHRERKNGESNEPFLIKIILSGRWSSFFRLLRYIGCYVSSAQRLPRSKSHSITHKSHSSLQAQENEKKPRVKRPRGRVDQSFSLVFASSSTSISSYRTTYRKTPRSLENHHPAAFSTTHHEDVGWSCR